MAAALILLKAPEPPTVTRKSGLVVPMPTPPEARTRNWLLVVDVKSASCESAQTKVPLWSAFALRPAANDQFPPARFASPPGTVEYSPEVVFALPPPMPEKSAFAWIMLNEPPAIVLLKELL